MPLARVCTVGKIPPNLPQEAAAGVGMHAGPSGAGSGAGLPVLLADYFENRTENLRRPRKVGKECGRQLAQRRGVGQCPFAP